MRISVRHIIRLLSIWAALLSFAVACGEPVENGTFVKQSERTPEAEYELLIFGVLTVDADSDMYQFSFADQEEKEDYLDRIRENSELDTEVSVTAEDRIVMLSTCTYEFEDARLVVYGKLVETEEE